MEEINVIMIPVVLKNSTELITLKVLSRDLYSKSMGVDLLNHLGLRKTKSGASCTRFSIKGLRMPDT